MPNSSGLSSANIGGASLYVTAANVTLSRTVLPTTALGDKWETNVYGVGRISGSVEVMYDKTSHANMVDQVEQASSSVTGTFTWDTGDTWTGQLLVTEAAATVSVDDLVKATISFVGTGTWTA